MHAEIERLNDARVRGAAWKKWGPYLSERQWGTVREDYSQDGCSWDYFTHDQARSRAYHWGEDGLAGISDDRQHLCFALALWNGKDPILKERLFGLTNNEGNHGEDVKEYYFYLDATPTHSYMKFLYKYPHSAYPYDDLVRKNRARSRNELEYELLDTGIFEGDRYFDVFVEYAKRTTEDILIEIRVVNRGPDAETIHLLPTLWFRNTWAWWPEGSKPQLKRAADVAGARVVEASHADLGDRYFCCDNAPQLLFTENETNNERVFQSANAGKYVKDGIHNFVVNGQTDAVNPENTGTKVAAHYVLTIDGGKTAVVRLRLTDQYPDGSGDVFGFRFNEIMEARRVEADEFYAGVMAPGIGEDKARIVRQALAGMLWSKQYFGLDVGRWLAEHGADPMQLQPPRVRNIEWFHMVNDDVISMPDKWEYPWYAAWDLAFHCIALGMVDLDFAKEQLDLLLQRFFLHPSGQIPAYEWNFSDVNPPVQAWAALFLYRTEQAHRGSGDVPFLRRCFRKLMLNFTWWVNRKDRFGKNVFEGGFLGLDNIGVFDRSATLPGGGHLEQADGTAWMALYCQNMLEICVELAGVDPSYDDIAAKFVDHFLWIACAINRVGPCGMWDEEDGFYYDVLRFPDGSATRLKVRSIVGLLPLCATTVIEPWQRERLPRTIATNAERVRHMPDLLESIHPTGPGHLGVGGRGMAALVNSTRLRRILTTMLDEGEFLGPYGIRALSRYHALHPYALNIQGQDYSVQYQPAESNTGTFGGNSNWRGPVWMPINVILIRALLSFYLYYGDSFRIECPTGSGHQMNLFEVAREITRRLTAIFMPDASGRRPVYGGTEKFQTDPHWKDYILFFEYFHGDNGAGIGASHQTGWTGCIAPLINLFANLDPKDFLEAGKLGAFVREEELASV
jgi:Mannosylglycerate hydrolase MGH1-like glycoside hydrolase domain